VYRLKDEAVALGIVVDQPNLNNNSQVGATLTGLLRVLYVKDGPAGGEAAASSDKQLTKDQEAAYDVTTVGNAELRKAWSARGPGGRGGGGFWAESDRLPVEAIFMFARRSAWASGETLLLACSF
jgi:hypothetical protein